MLMSSKFLFGGRGSAKHSMKGVNWLVALDSSVSGGVDRWKTVFTKETSDK